MDARFDQDEAELGVLVLAVAFEVFADGDGLLGGVGSLANIFPFSFFLSVSFFWCTARIGVGVWGEERRTFLINM